MKLPFPKVGLITVLLVFSTPSVEASNSCRSIFSREAPELRSYEEILGKQNPLTAVTLTGIPESKAFKRLGVLLQGLFKPKFAGKIEDKVNGDISVYFPSSKRRKFDGIDYVEFPNSTAMTTINPKTGEQREFILTRGVRPYQAGIRLSKKGANSPDGYISDVLLFELVHGKPVFRHRILDSVPEKLFFFEDPRISVINENGHARYFLSGTDYAPHVPGSKNPDVMNRYVELEISNDGVPLKVQTNKVTKKPDFKNLSPQPLFRNGSWLFVDAKNATIAQNDLGQIVVRARMRPDFNNPEIQKLAEGFDQWGYAEQVFVFRDFEHFESYNWNDTMVDLFNKRSSTETSSDVAPLYTKIIMRERDLTEHLTLNKENARLTPNKAKGFGPGTRPLRIERKGSTLFISDGPGAVQYQKNIPKELLSRMKIEDGQSSYLTFDHEIRYYDQNVDGTTLTRRNYTGSVKIFDRTAANLIGYLPDVVQAKTAYERGQDSGILDLQHVYFMGLIVKTDPATGEPVVIATAGTSDAHTAAYEVDIVTLFSEERPANKWY